MDSDNDKIPKIEEVEGGKEINTLIGKVNDFNENFIINIKRPLDKQRMESLKFTMLNTTKGAGIKHAYVGAVLCMVAAKPDMKSEELQKMFTFMQEEPFVKV
mgnify:CR=1 FL=1